VGKTKTRWEDITWRDISQILGIQGQRRRVVDREEWGSLLWDARAQKGLQHHTWSKMEFEQKKIKLRNISHFAENKTEIMLISKMQYISLLPKYIK